MGLFAAVLWVTSGEKKHVEIQFSQCFVSLQFCASSCSKVVTGPACSPAPILRHLGTDWWVMTWRSINGRFCSCVLWYCLYLWDEVFHLIWLIPIGQVDRSSQTTCMHTRGAASCLSDRLRGPKKITARPKWGNRRKREKEISTNKINKSCDWISPPTPQPASLEMNFLFIHPLTTSSFLFFLPEMLLQ